MGKGARRERQAAELFRSAGWAVYRPATVKYGENDVFGLFDLLAISPAHSRVRAVQVKSNGARGIRAYQRQTWLWRRLGWRCHYLVAYDDEGWRYINVYDDGWCNVVDERDRDCAMGEAVTEWLGSERCKSA